MSRLNVVICKLLKKQLKKAGLSYQDVAKYMNLSEVSVKRLLNQQQPISITLMIEISELVQTPLSTILIEAEKLVASVALFSQEQDLAFCEHPELYTVFMQIINESASSTDLMKQFDLDEPSVYLYLRGLEKIGLITITSGLHFRLSVPKHISFSNPARFPMYFKNQIIDGLKEQVQCIDPNKNEAYFITAKLRLTEEEFIQYNMKLEELMQETLKLSQTRDATTIHTSEYTIVGMGAQGRFRQELKKPTNHICKG